MDDISPKKKRQMQKQQEKWASIIDKFKERACSCIAVNPSTTNNQIPTVEKTSELNSCDCNPCPELDAKKQLNISASNPLSQEPSDVSSCVSPTCPCHSCPFFEKPSSTPITKISGCDCDPCLVTAASECTCRAESKQLSIKESSACSCNKGDGPCTCEPCPKQNLNVKTNCFCTTCSCSKSLIDPSSAVASVTAKTASQNNCFCETCSCQQCRLPAREFEECVCGDIGECTCTTCLGKATRATGAIGPPGTTGVIGASGITGVIGASGTTGGIGAPGITGAIGPAGTTGVIGGAGATGLPGTMGVTLNNAECFCETCSCNQCNIVNTVRNQCMCNAEGDNCICRSCLFMGNKPKPTQAAEYVCTKADESCDCNPCSFKPKIPTNRRSICACNPCDCDNCSRIAGRTSQTSKCSCKTPCECAQCYYTGTQHQLVQTKKLSVQDIQCLCETCDCVHCVEAGTSSNRAVTAGNELTRNQYDNKKASSTVCSCAVCDCNPCPHLSTNNETTTPTTYSKCNCVACDCSPCPYLNANKQNMNQGSTGRCDCNVCDCNPCPYLVSNEAQRSTRETTTSTCKCSVCDCSSCAYLTKVNQPASNQVPSNMPIQNVATSAYTPKPCNCSKRELIKQTVPSRGRCLCGAPEKDFTPARRTNTPVRGCTCGPQVSPPKGLQQTMVDLGCTCDSNLELPQKLSTLECICASQSKTSAFDLTSMSAFSIKSTDIEYMERVKQLSLKQKSMAEAIKELEYREKAYKRALKRTDQGDTAKDKQRENDLLKQINMLTDELKDTQLELKQVREKLEGPLLRQIEREKMAYEALEQQMDDLRNAMEAKELGFLNEVKELKIELEAAYQNICTEKIENKRIQEEMRYINCKYRELQNDLINQKLSEARTLQQLTQELNMKKQAPYGDMGGAGENLDTIARQLSQTLREAAECEECEVPEELRDTVEYIKDIADLVAEAKGSGEGKVPVEELEVEMQVDELEVEVVVQQQIEEGIEKPSEIETEAVEVVPIEPAVSVEKRAEEPTEVPIEPQVAAEVEAVTEAEVIEAELPTEAEVPREEEIPVKAEITTEVEVTAEAEIPAEAEAKIPAGAEVIAEVEIPAEAEITAEAGIPAEPEIPAEAEITVEAEIPAEVEIPAQAEITAEAEIPAQAEIAAKAEIPAQAEITAEAEIPVEAKITVEAEIIVEAEITPEAKIPAEAELPVEIPAEAEIPVEVEIPAGAPAEAEMPAKAEIAVEAEAVEVVEELPVEIEMITPEVPEISPEVAEEPIKMAEEPIKMPAELEVAEKISITAEPVGEAAAPEEIVKEPSLEAVEQLPAEVVVEQEVEKAVVEEAPIREDLEISGVPSEAVAEVESEAGVPTEIAEPEIVPPESAEISARASVTKEVSKPPSEISTKRVSKASIEGRVSSKISAKKSVEAAPDEAGELVPVVAKIPSELAGQVEIITEVETEGDFDITIETEVIEKSIDGLHITTTVTESGTLEVVTEGPAGLIETTMTYSPSGNIEVVTEVTDYAEGSETAGPKAISATDEDGKPPSSGSKHSEKASISVKSSVKSVKSAKSAETPEATDAEEADQMETESEGKPSELLTPVEESGSTTEETSAAESGLISGSEPGESGISSVKESEATVRADESEVTTEADGVEESAAEEIGIEETSVEEVNEYAITVEAILPPDTTLVSGTIEIIDTQMSEVTGLEITGVTGSERTASSEFTSAEAIPSSKCVECPEMEHIEPQEPCIKTCNEGQKEGDEVVETLYEKGQVAGMVTQAESGAAEETAQSDLKFEADIEVDLDEYASGLEIIAEMDVPKETQVLKKPKVRLSDDQVTPTLAQTSDTSSGESTDYVDAGNDLRKGVTDALNKANKDVLNALEQANRNVNEALEKANKDVESALNVAVKESKAHTKSKKPYSTTVKSDSGKLEHSIVDEEEEEFQAAVSQAQSIERRDLSPTRRKSPAAKRSGTTAAQIEISAGLSRPDELTVDMHLSLSQDMYDAKQSLSASEKGSSPSTKAVESNKRICGCPIDSRTSAKPSVGLDSIKEPQQTESITLKVDVVSTFKTATPDESSIPEESVPLKQSFLESLEPEEPLVLQEGPVPEEVTKEPPEPETVQIQEKTLDTEPTERESSQTQGVQVAPDIKLTSTRSCGCPETSKSKIPVRVRSGRGSTAQSPDIKTSRPKSADRASKRDGGKDVNKSNRRGSDTCKANLDREPKRSDKETCDQAPKRTPSCEKARKRTKPKTDEDSVDSKLSSSDKAEKRSEKDRTRSKRRGDEDSLDSRISSEEKPERRSRRSIEVCSCPPHVRGLKEPPKEETRTCQFCKCGACECNVCDPEIMRKRLLAANFDCIKAAKLAQEDRKRRSLSECDVSKVKSDTSNKVITSSVPISNVASGERTDAHPKGCRCCECDSDSPDKNKLVAKTPSGDATPTTHKANCTCIKCICESSSFFKIPESIVAVVETTSGPSDVSKAPHPPDCTCLDCLCEAVPGTLTPITEHPSDCDCVDCLCEPCNKVRKKMGNTQSTITEHDSSCDCPKCLCEACPDTLRAQRDLLEKDASEVKPPPEALEEKPVSRVHPGDCDCLECICKECPDVKKAAESSHAENCDCLECICKVPVSCSDQHPPDCDCIECICDAIKQEVRSPEFKKSGHPEECVCPECICQECEFLKSRSSHADDCDCPECVCEHCVQAQQHKDKGGPMKDDKKADHPPGCDCLKCLCEKCEYLKGKPEGDHPTGCECLKCLCEKCEYIKGLLKGQSDECPCPECTCEKCNALKTELGHTVDCDCPECLCVDCADVKKQKGEHPPECDCFTCLCKPIEKKEKEEEKCTCPKCECVQCQYLKAKLSHLDDCACLKCSCDDCKNPRKPKGSTLHPGDCDCVLCSCIKCKDTKRRAADNNKEDEKVQKVGDADVKGAKHGEDCICPKCICEECIDPSKGKKVPSEIVGKTFGPEKHAQDCVCPKCVCDECIDPKMRKKSAVGKEVGKTFGQEKHVQDCMCPKCVCDECIDPKMRKKSAVEKEVGKTFGQEKHAEDCMCPKCLCDECIDPKKRKEVITPKEAGKTFGEEKHALDCICAKCICDDCLDPNMIRGKSKEKTVEAAMAKGEKHTKDCDCTKCTCKKCKDQKILAARSEMAKHDDTCFCPECTCEECRDSNKRKGVEGHASDCDCSECVCVKCKNLKKRNQIECHGENCTCTECICPECKDVKKRGRKQIEKHGDDCTCPKCTCSLCRDMKERKQSGEKHSNDCECSQCMCETCKDPKKRKTVAGDPMSQENEEHTSDCRCSECTCIECFDLTKQKSPLPVNLPPTNDHPPGCDCIDCLIKQYHGPNCNCPTCACEYCPDPKLNRSDKKKPPKTDKENEARQKELDELRLLIEQIRCSCREAEQASMQQNPANEPEKPAKRMLPPVTPESRTRDRPSTAPVGSCVCPPTRKEQPQLKDKCVCPDKKGTNRKMKEEKQRSCPTFGSSQPSQDNVFKPCICADIAMMEPIQITDVRRIAPTSLLIKWKSPSGSCVIGYEIYVDNTLKARVHNPDRTSAVVDNLKLEGTASITLHAILENGQSSAPGKFVYNVK